MPPAPHAAGPVSATLERVLEVLRATERDTIARLLDWLRIPSISTDPAYGGDVRRAAQWAADQLRELGLDVRVIETADEQGRPGHPVVLARTPAPLDIAPHVLFYGHYDVQPADPLQEWDSPPFEPVIRPAVPGGPGERIVARGAVDDKGQVMTFLWALRAWKDVTGRPAGGLPLTVLLEGEEECGSMSLPRFLREHADALRRCHVCLISDTGMLGRGRPAITTGVRGLAYTEITLHGPDQDLHSGLWGGRVPNPLNELVKVLAQLWDADRRVAIEGFYDDVRPLSEEERRAWRTLPFDADQALRQIGLSPDADVGEKGYSALERAWGRPTAEINGLVGGYTGPGAKTVIPAKATAKVSFRLVADQDPQKIVRLFFDWLRRRTPPGCRWECRDLHGGWGATIGVDSPFLKVAARALEEAAGVSPALIRSGGSIPVAGMLKAMLGLDTIFMGFGLDDDRVHAPNEKFELDCLRLGARAHAILIGQWLTGTRG